MYFVKSPLTIDRESNSFRVIKVGGSLFNMPDLKNRVLDWSEAIADESSINVWVCGGGAMVDEVRNWQSRHGLDDETAHRISIGLMSQTAELFQSLFINWPLVGDVSQINSVDVKLTPNIVFDCRQWALNNISLKRSWETTSDTIALQLATESGASHLYLLKSKSPKSDRAIEAVEDGLIDRNFSSSYAKESRLKTSIVNLRESNVAFELFW